ncbi:MAG: HRDC domain-containing protein, partial [Archangium sp.]|nr:HRDC domain-containing protein [Archangium sp.]
PEVRDDISRALLMKDPQVFVAGFDRPNLFLEVVNVGGEDDKRRAVAQLAEEGSGIVYCSTRKQTDTLFESLTSAGTKVVQYHAGMDDDARRQAHDTFLAEERIVAVATNAFGMGIDKPGIRFVAHASIPRAVEAYYQEIGRAGRDGGDAHAVLLFNHADVHTQERLIASNYPSEALFRDVWDVLRRSTSYDRGVHALAGAVGVTEFEVSAALKVLEREGVVSRGGRGEGRYGFTLLPAAVGHAPRSDDAKTLLRELRTTFPSGVGTTELYLLSRRTGLDDERLRHALTLLERSQVVAVQRPFSGRTIAALSTEPWSTLGVDVSRVREQERAQMLLLKRMTDYAYVKRCRRAFVLRYFGEAVPFSQSCGSCDVCSGPKLAVKKAASSPPRGPTGERVLPTQYSAMAAEALKRWRRELAADLGVPPFIIFNDATLYGLAAALPASRDEFMRVKGTGESRWERFGPKVVDICVMARAAGDAPQYVAPKVRRRRA